jgi:hypothetical protein
MINKTIIDIVSHTEKSFAVVTNKIIRYQDSLTNLGGIFDPNITVKETGENLMGWLFYIDRKNEIQNWINEGCIPIQKVIKQDMTRQRLQQILFPPKTNACVKKITLSPVNMIECDRIKSIEKTVEILITKINSIEITNNILLERINSVETELNFLKNINKIEISSDTSSNLEEEYEIFEQVDIDEDLSKSKL